MLADTITLNVINDDSKESWLKGITYNAFSPRYDWSINLLKAKHVSEKATELEFKQIQVRSTATVDEVIDKARSCFAGYDSYFKVVELREGVPYGYHVEYRLYYPALSNKNLDGSTKISDLGLVNDDLVIISQWDTRPHGAPLTMSGVSSFEKFQEMVWEEQNPYDPMLLAALLYTDEDVDLAKYVREHFDELHQMSGPRVITYVVERPPKDSALAASLFWKSLLDVTVYRAWNLLGWTQSQPYNKATAYEIARSLSIYPDQLPCLAVFDRTGQEEKIVFPISGDLTTFFRKTFSNIQYALYQGPGPDIIFDSARDKARRKLFNKIRKSLRLIQKDTKNQRIVYNFYGQTVFINHPSGPIQLQDFQNTKRD